MKLDFSRQIFEKYSNIKFNENPSSGNRVDACGRTDRQTDRQPDLQKTDGRTDRQMERQTYRQTANG